MIKIWFAPDGLTFTEHPAEQLTMTAAGVRVNHGQDSTFWPWSAIRNVTGRNVDFEKVEGA